jgi:hypothetical protein
VESPVAKAFVVSDDLELPPNSLTALDGVAVVTGDLFGRGIQALFRNFLAGRDVNNGIAGLTDEAGFLRAVRRLTDSIYAHTGAARILDVSPMNPGVIDRIAAVYPDAALIRTPADADVVARQWAEPAEPPAPLPEVKPLAGPPIFIVGVPRSATTWVENMLLAHPAIAGPEVETSVFLSLRALRDNVRRPDGVSTFISETDFVVALRGFVAGLFGEWLDAVGRREARFLEKTPLHAEHLPLIAEVFPDAAIIGIHRDGRDVVRSLLEMDAATNDVVVAAKAWTDITRAVSAAVATMPNARDERYEAMLRDPVSSVIELLRWLGLDVDAATTEEVQRRSGERVSQYNTTGDVGPGKWASLSARELREVYRHAGARLVELGYVTEDELPRRRWWRR